MLENSGHDSSQTKGWLNDVGSVLLFNHIHYFIFERNVQICQSCVASFHWNLDLSVCIESKLVFCFLCLRQLLEYSVDSLRIFFELFSYDLSIDNNIGLLFLSGLLESS
jgi:hypothetical protein